jgi:hypothetical protein
LFAGTALTAGGELLQDHPDSFNGDPARREGKLAKRKCVTCEDCYFKRNMLCALRLSEPCPTFRHADKGLRPEQQLAFVFRTERTRTAYAFPQPH